MYFVTQNAVVFFFVHVFKIVRFSVQKNELNVDKYANVQYKNSSTQSTFKQDMVNAVVYQLVGLM